MRLIKKGFDPFKSQSYQAQNKKKYCIEKLIRASMGEQKRKFILWRQIVKEDKILGHTKLFERIFSSCENKIEQNIFTLFKDAGKQLTKKKWLCRKLIDNSNFVQHHAYFIWKEAHQIDNVLIEK